MSEYCVVAAEVARARIFTLEPAEIPEFDSGPTLVERKTLANPQHKAGEGQFYTETRRGANKNFTQAQRASKNQTASIPHHNYDEHRDRNEWHNNRDFARNVVSELESMVASNGYRRVVLCAETQMLGYLRPEISDRLSRNVELQEVPKDLTRLTTHELHQKLAKEGFLPQRNKRVPPG